MILVKEEVSLGAIGRLSNSLEFVPSPKEDKPALRLDMKLVTNEILSQSKKNLRPEQQPESEMYNLPAKLRRKVYNSAPLSADEGSFRWKYPWSS